MGYLSVLPFVFSDLTDSTVESTPLVERCKSYCNNAVRVNMVHLFQYADVLIPSQPLDHSTNQ